MGIRKEETEDRKPTLFLYLSNLKKRGSKQTKNSQAIGRTALPIPTSGSAEGGAGEVRVTLGTLGVKSRLCCPFRM